MPCGAAGIKRASNQWGCGTVIALEGAAVAGIQGQDWFVLRAGRDGKWQEAAAVK